MPSFCSQRTHLVRIKIKQAIISKISYGYFHSILKIESQTFFDLKWSFARFKRNPLAPSRMFGLASYQDQLTPTSNTSSNSNLGPGQARFLKHTVGLHISTPKESEFKQPLQSGTEDVIGYNLISRNRQEITSLTCKPL